MTVKSISLDERLFPGGVRLPDLLDMTNIPVANMLMPLNFCIPSFNAPIPNVDMLVDNYI